MTLAYNGTPLTFGGAYLAGPTPVPLLFADEFNTLSLVTADDDATHTWRTRSIVDQGSVAQSYQDYSARSWNPSPIQWPEHSPYSVADSVLTITVRRNPGLAGSGTSPWLGGLLVSNHLRNLHFTRGYYEWRVAFPEPIRGMFPALWLYDPLGARQRAEIDMLEIFGNPTGRPFVSNLHIYLNDGPTNSGRQVVSSNTDTAGWHRYGVELTDDALRFYKDGELIGSATSDEAAYFQTAEMAVHIGYVMDPQWLAEGDPARSTPTDPAPGVESRMLVDYIRVWESLPPGLPTGTDDPLNMGGPTAIPPA